MILEDLVLSIEQSKHLQELGLDMSDAALCWDSKYPFGDEDEQAVWEITEGIRNILKGKEKIAVTDAIPTYTLQEVLGKIPEKITYRGLVYKLESDCKCWINYYTGSDDNRDYLEDSNSVSASYIDAVYNLFYWLLKNKLYEP